MGFIKQWLPYILAGISAGGQYALIAVGYTMVYGILRLINFAHGDIFMVAGLLMVYLSASMPLYVSIPAVVVLTVALAGAMLFSDKMQGAAAPYHPTRYSYEFYHGVHGIPAGEVAR